MAEAHIFHLFFPFDFGSGGGVLITSSLLRACVCSWSSTEQYRTCTAIEGRTVQNSTEHVEHPRGEQCRTCTATEGRLKFLEERGDGNQFLAKCHDHIVVVVVSGTQRTFDLGYVECSMFVQPSNFGTNTGVAIPYPRPNQKG